MSGMKGSDGITVLVVMKDQVDVATLDKQLHTDRTSLRERHASVVGSLQAKARQTQGGLLSELEAAKALGTVEGYTPHWIVNGLVVRGTIDALREIAARDDVERIEPDLVVELIEPVPSEKPRADAIRYWASASARASGPIGAPRVWNELGINGAGVIVGELDTGVDGTHPALAARWQGNFAPASAVLARRRRPRRPDFPVDRHYHGTHTMGTMTGLAPDDTIGVAPGAHWIAEQRASTRAPGTTFDNARHRVVRVDGRPRRQPATPIDDVPCVVQNSWGVNEGFSGYFDCDSRWWDAIDNCEAAGVVRDLVRRQRGPRQRHAALARRPRRDAVQLLQRRRHPELRALRRSPTSPAAAPAAAAAPSPRSPRSARRA